MKKLPKISLILILLVGIFLIKLYLIHPSFSDENIYYAMSKVVSEGQEPYRDFNFVHPPIQLYLLAGIFKVLGPSIITAKLLPLLSSSLSVILMFLISKRLFDEKSALLSCLMFIITPVFLAFSDQGYGMWEALSFLLLSLYLALRQKYLISGVSFSIALFTRYLSALFFPLILLILFLHKLKWRQFLLFSIVSSGILFFLFYLIYGFNFIDQSILFQFFAKSNWNLLPKLPFQYLSFGFFSIFLAIISLVIGINSKEKYVVIFSLYPLIVDLSIFLGFTTIIYHYFLLSLSFVFLALGRSFILAKDKIIRIGIIGILLIFLYHNFATVEYYQNPSHSKYFFEIADFVSNRTSAGDKMFGESSITTYIMFTKGIPISSNYLDSFISYLVYKDEKTVIANLEKEKPKIIIDMSQYYKTNPFFNQYLSEKYQPVATFSGVPTYIVYMRNSS